MNAFREHHEDSIRFGYRCFDRLLLNGLIQPFQQPERVVRFFTRYRDQYLDVQQDILETLVDRGQLRRLAEPTVLPSGKRIPGLKLDHSRQLALMHALVRFAHAAAGGTFRTADVYPATIAALGVAPETYSVASLRYDLSKLRAKGLVDKVPHSRRYRLLPEGYRLGVVFLKLFERIYAPLTAGLLQPIHGDARLQDVKRHQLDRLYQRVVDDLDRLLAATESSLAAP